VALVLTQNESTESGHRYADELGVEYEYPTRYRNRVRPGEPFVYYRGRRRAEGGLQPQVYLGTGVVGAIRPSETEGRLVCSIEDFDPFPSPLPFKLDGDYLEPLGAVPPDRAGLYFRQGVREIDEETYARILAAAAARDPAAGRRKHEAALPWAPPEIARLVDEIAMEIVLGRLEADHPEAIVSRMPHNNPGYDIRVKDEDGIRFAEVKGTTRALPHFFMSEGERLFSHDHAAHYTLFVVYAVDTGERTGQVLTREGAVAGDDLALHPVQWEGALAPAPED
jgi:hypothetical protein